MVTPETPPDAEFAIAFFHSPGDWQIYAGVNQIRDIAVDGEFIWAASDGGLLCWERETGNVIQYQAPDFPLPGNNLSHLILKSSKLYISGDKGLTVFDQYADWTYYSEAEIGMSLDRPAPMASINRLIWLAGREGVARLRPADEHWETLLRKPDQFWPAQVEEIFQNSDGVYLKGSMADDPNSPRTWMHYTNPDWEKTDALGPRFLKTPDGLWWDWREDGLFSSSNQGWTWHQVSTLPGPGELHWVDDTGRIYASAGDTIWVFQEGQPVGRYAFSDLGPALLYISAVQGDNQGHLWVASDSGLTSFDGKRWQSWPMPDENGVARSFLALAASDESVYALSSNEELIVLDLETREWQSVAREESGSDGEWLPMIAVDVRGRAGLLTGSGILDLYDGVRWEHVPLPVSDPESMQVDAAIFDSQGTYWVAITRSEGGRSRSYLLNYQDRQWGAYRMPGALHALASDANRIWAGMADRLGVRDSNGDWLFYMTDKMPCELKRIDQLVTDFYGRIWMTDGKSLLVFNGQDFQDLTAGLPDNGYAIDPLGMSSSGTACLARGNSLMIQTLPVDMPRFSGFRLPPQERIPEAQLQVPLDY